MDAEGKLVVVAMMAATLYPHISVPAGSGGTRNQTAVDTAAKLLELALELVEAKYAPTR